MLCQHRQAVDSHRGFCAERWLARRTDCRPVDLNLEILHRPTGLAKSTNLQSRLLGIDGLDPLAGADRTSLGDDLHLGNLARLGYDDFCLSVQVRLLTLLFG